MAMKGKSYGQRMELEGIALYIAACRGIRYAKRKVKSTIAKDLGFKGKAKYLTTTVDYSIFPDYNNLNAHAKEALKVSWSMFN